MTQPEDESKVLLDPMLDLFSGADGGVAFAKLRHSFLPDMLSKRGDENVDEFLTMVERFSRLCTLMLEKK